MKTYFITGGAGFVGSHFVHYLHETDPGAMICIIDKMTYAGSMANIESFAASPRHLFYHGDICSEEVMEMLYERHRPYAVINFAAESHVDRSIENSREFIRTNVEGLRNMLDISVKYGVKRFMQISTDEVYGSIANGSFTEKACLNPKNPYAASKAAGDLLALSYGYTHGLPVLVTRSANNFGESQHSEKLIPKIIENAFKLKKIPIYGDGRQKREWIYVKDHCSAIGKLLENFKSGQIYNISSGLELKNIELAKRLIRETASRLKAGDPRIKSMNDNLIEFAPDRKGHDFRYSVQWDKLREDTGWKPSYSFEKAIAKTVDWHVERERLRDDKYENSL
ncbi:MAG: dTDP-glucose 4,6-dehydratase [Peptostreptococcaceae bacterium]|nr:dTDP-glucose 4,6-dehydratase [Peptostreptococcaceae bacterium]